MQKLYRQMDVSRRFYMGLFSFFSSQSKSAPLSTPIYEVLLECANENALDLYSEIPIYHRQNKIHIPILLFDAHRGIYLIERVDWHFDQIKNATAKAATPDVKERDVSVDARHAFIRRKFNEILHTDGCNISNFALMEHLSEAEFDQLDESFHRLMPKNRIIFADSDSKTIKTKLAAALSITNKPLERAMLLGALFFHLSVLPDNLSPYYHLLTREQSAFISAPLVPYSTISGPYGSGKSTLILLKAIYELLQDPSLSIMIIMPTLAPCDLLKKRLLEIIEYAIIDIDLSSIIIITPQQLITQHYQKLYKKESFSFAKITPKMLSHRHQNADIVFVDDGYLLDDEFLSYITYQQKKARLCLITDKPDATWQLQHAFRPLPSFLAYCNHNESEPASAYSHITEYSGNPYMHIMLLLNNELKAVDHSKILIVVPHFAFAQKLTDEINGYYDTVSAVYQSDGGLLEQQLDHILIALAGSISHLQRPYVIVVKDNQVSHLHFCHALGRASQALYIIEDEKEEITQEDIKTDTSS